VFSPDGHRIAYESDETGRAEIYVESFSWPPEANRRRIAISGNGGSEPIWSPKQDPYRLYYRDGNQMMAVDFDATLAPAEPKVLFSGKYASDGLRAAYNVSADGRLLMMKVGEDYSSAQINIIFDWGSLAAKGTR